MKRGKPLERRTPLARGTTVLKRSPLTARRRRRATDRDAARSWRESAQRPCVLCGGHDVQAHHIIYQQVLLRTATSRGLSFEALRWDHRCALPLCRDTCHPAHHAGRRRVTRNELARHAPAVFDMAAELDLVWWLERTYPLIVR